ncbi:hypothetical protein AU509_07350 [Lonsdalea britannica]|uniref:Uncharacterized protein n=1 Tax=Lonsdalea britannica TaxID=1082704 RepID=A0AAD0WLU7_9GAMM|nr:hypothetical protein [Lonsdalea britannica]AXW87783.1 hypothetical protein CKQ53_12930 [Lonsdalea britannica]OSM98329.1 hypothetical protein AU509_07350 [Lonsdalea britannica]
MQPSIIELTTNLSAATLSINNVSDALGLNGDGPLSLQVITKLTDLLADNETLRAMVQELTAQRDALVEDGKALQQTRLPLSGREIGFFSYDGIDCCFREHESIEMAVKDAGEALDYCRDMAGSEGWPEETDTICWGVIIQRATMHSKHQPDPETENTDFDYICEYDFMGADMASGAQPKALVKSLTVPEAG